MTADFAVIYGGEAQLTPRIAAHLWSAALFIAHPYGNGDQLDLLRQELPPVAPHLTLAHFGWPKPVCKAFSENESYLASVRPAALAAPGRIRTSDARFRNGPKPCF